MRGELDQHLDSIIGFPPNRSPMALRNIPTDLLRAFVTIVDLQGFTRAGERLGRSQPAISLQMKRLEDAVGAALLERTQGGVPKLTEAGEEVANYARRILALNDELVMRLKRKGRQGRLRIGMPNDYADFHLAQMMRSLRGADEEIALEVTCDLSVNLLRGFREGALDVVVAQTVDCPAEGAVYSWRDPMAWLGLDGPPEQPGQPIRIIAYPEGCNYRRLMLTALQREARAYEIVYVSPSLAGLEAALRAGFGYTAMSRRSAFPGLVQLGTADGFPAVADIVGGVYVRPDIKSGSARLLANTVAELLTAGFEKAAA